MTEELVHVSELGAHRHHVLSQRLRERRRALGLTQKEVVARLRRLGVTTTNKALSSLEHGAGLDVAKLPELACALECTLTYLVGLTEHADQWFPDPAEWPHTPEQARAHANGTGQNGTGQNGTGQNGTGQNGTGQNRPGPDPPILGPLTDR